MYKLSKIGIAFNLMKFNVDYKDKHLHYQSIDNIFLEKNTVKKLLKMTTTYGSILVWYINNDQTKAQNIILKFFNQKINNNNDLNIKITDKIDSLKFMELLVELEKYQLIHLRLKL